MEPAAVLGQARIDVGVSVGVALFPDHGEDVDTLMRHADVAMYVAKRARSGYAVYSPEQDEHSALQLSLMGELRSTIRAGGLVLHYQPEINLLTGELSRVEALVRWHHPSHGLLPPDQFIPSAEQTDMIGPLTRWVLDDSLRQLGVWREAGLDFGVSVNLSAGNLHDTSLPDLAASKLQQWKIPANRLTVEITESAIMAAPAVRTLAALSDLGVGVSIDDFGTGYSSLAYLKDLPVNQIKIDRSFVINMASNTEDAGIVRPTIDLGHNLGIEVVAEGVEDAGALQMLRDFGCDFAQGFHISRPLPADQVVDWISRRGLASTGTKP
jgi:EAL domain-containing protein (putative c-di-GMP-specific phosphodiesterase class I)